MEAPQGAQDRRQPRGLRALRHQDAQPVRPVSGRAGQRRGQCGTARLVLPGRRFHQCQVAVEDGRAGRLQQWPGRPFGADRQQQHGDRGCVEQGQRGRQRIQVGLRHRILAPRELGEVVRQHGAVVPELEASLRAHVLQQGDDELDVPPRLGHGDGQHPRGLDGQRVLPPELAPASEAVVPEAPRHREGVLHAGEPEGRQAGDLVHGGMPQHDLEQGGCARGHRGVRPGRRSTGSPAGPRAPRGRRWRASGKVSTGASPVCALTTARSSSSRIRRRGPPVPGHSCERTLAHRQGQVLPGEVAADLGAHERGIAVERHRAVAVRPDEGVHRERPVRRLQPLHQHRETRAMRGVAVVLLPRSGPPDPMAGHPASPRGPPTRARHAFFRQVPRHAHRRQRCRQAFPQRFDQVRDTSVVRGEHIVPARRAPPSRSSSMAAATRWTSSDVVRCCPGRYGVRCSAQRASCSRMPRIAAPVRRRRLPSRSRSSAARARAKSSTMRIPHRPMPATIRRKIPHRSLAGRSSFDKPSTHAASRRLPRPKSWGR